jgi:hypothetical protein
MPYKDPEKKKQKMREWRKGAIASGYGKWLYERRKLRFDDAERFRAAIEHTLEYLRAISPKMKPEDRDRLLEVSLEELERALRESREAEEALGPFKRGDDE